MGITLVGMSSHLAEMANGQLGCFCTSCGRLAVCPQCGDDLTGKTVCHRTMSTHFRDMECKWNGNHVNDYKMKGRK